MRTPPPLPRQQRGALLILLVIALGVLAVALFVGMLSSSEIQIDRDKKTTAALAEAKAALIGWSANPPPTASSLERPGELPCPDISAPGSLYYGSAPSTCVAGAIGRVPWKTLGIAEPKDGYGETLWYALDGKFRRRASNIQPINSDTRPTMQVYASDGTTLLTPAGSEAVAIIFSAGPVLGNQTRGTASQQTNAANYLDSASPPILPTAFNNATPNGPFIQGLVRDGAGNNVINDRLLIVTAHDIMNIVERRVAKDLIATLIQYETSNGYYPYPAKYNYNNINYKGCLDEGSNAYFTQCSSDPSTCRGRVPDDIPSLPAWFSYNLWGQTFYYSVGTNYLNPITVPLNCSQSLTVDGTPGFKALFFTPGTPLGSIVRNAPTQSINLPDYLEDAQNNDGWSGTAPGADSYCTPGTTSCLPTPAHNTNDHLYILR